MLYFVTVLACVVATTPLDMGCCICRPITDVTDNSAVPSYVSVGLTATFNQHCPKVNATQFGFLYIKDNELRHDFTLGNRLVCRWCTKSWKLAHIQEITMINGAIELPNTDVTIIPPLFPGIKITLQDATGNGETTLVMAMAYTTVANANRFGVILGRCVDTAKALRSLAPRERE